MEMNIVYSSDDKYVRHIYISMMSLFESQPSSNKINVYLVDNNISEENHKRLNNMAENYNQVINYLPFSDVEGDLEGVTLWGNSLSTYARLFLGRYLEADIVLYMDGDSVIRDDLSPLFALDLSNYYLAAVQDTAGTLFRQKVGIEGNEKYVNSGFALLNLKKWRDEGIEEKFLAFIRKFDGNVPCCDQGTLNGVCKDKILILPPKYNVMTPMLTFNANEIKEFFDIPEYYSQYELDDARKHPVFIHYVGGFYTRPWFANGNHPQMDIYRNYMEQSPWKGQYYPNENLGIKTKFLQKAYKILPFQVFIALYRLIRNIKRKVS